MGRPADGTKNVCGKHWRFRSMFLTVPHAVWCDPCSKQSPHIPMRGAVSSVVERFVYTEDVGSSTLSPPTILSTA
jgi:hypothetical protein